MYLYFCPSIVLTYALSLQFAYANLFLTVWE